MAFSISELGEIDFVIGQLCLQQVPAVIKNEVDYDYEVDVQNVVIFEVRPVWRGNPGEKTRRPIAKFRFLKVRHAWLLYWMRASGKWQIYGPNPSTHNLSAALKVVTADSYGCFLG